MEIKKYIKMCCVAREISDSALAERMGQSPQNLHNKYKRNVFKNTELEKIAEALDATLEIRFIDKKTGKPII